jgi:hypothetical protein
MYANKIMHTMTLSQSFKHVRPRIPPLSILLHLEHGRFNRGRVGRRWPGAVANHSTPVPGAHERAQDETLMRRETATKAQYWCG